MPWEENPNFIRSGHRSVGDPCRTIVISAEQGIKAVYCKYGDKWGIQSYLFAKDHGWTMARAKAWFSSHNEDLEEGLGFLKCPGCGVEDGVPVYAVGDLAHGIMASSSNEENPLYYRCLSCEHRWGEAEKGRGRHVDFGIIYNNFINFFGGKNGGAMYHDFLKQNKLDETQPYSLTQLTESFKWVEQSIKYWKHDEEAKYYRARLLTANISMNKNDYANKNDMVFAASNLAWRPLNLDHNHSLRLGFPDSRLEIGKLSEEGNSIEAVLRIHDNAKAKDTGESVQTLIEKGEILHPSIEAFPICGLRQEDGRTVPTCGYYIDEVALLRKNKTLPGDPLSQIFSIPLNEALATRLIESLSAKQNHDPGVLGVERSSLEESEEVSLQGKEESNQNQTSRGEKSKLEKETKIPARELEAKEFNPDVSWPDSCFAYLDLYKKTGNKSDRKIPYRWPDGDVSWPNVTSALSRLAQAGTDIPDADKAELIKKMQNLMKQHDPDYEPTAESATEVEAKLAKANADHVAEKLDLQKDIEERDAKILECNRKVVSLQETLTGFQRKIAESESLKAQFLEKTQKLAEVEAEFRELQGKYVERGNQLDAKNVQCGELQEAMKQMQASIGTAKEKLVSTQRELNEALVKKAESDQKSINETRDRSRIQLENAELREDAAKLTREISDLSQKRVEDAKRVYALEKENNGLKETISQNDAEKERLEERLKKASRHLKIVNKVLSDAKIEVQPPIPESV